MHFDRAGRIWEKDHDCGAIELAEAHEQALHANTSWQQGVDPLERRLHVICRDLVLGVRCVQHLSDWREVGCQCVRHALLYAW